MQASDMVTMVGNGTSTVVDEPGNPQPTRGRMYLLKPNDYSATCDSLTPPAQTLPLSTTAGTWQLPTGQSAFPADNSAIGDSLVCVPARLDTVGTNQPPDAPHTRVWSAQFSGTLDPDQVNNRGEAFTSFAIFTNESLFPGWQLDPCVQGGWPLPQICPSHGITNPAPGANAFNIQLSYDFESDGTPDRIEQYRNVQLLPSGNTFSDKNKQTEYRFDQVWPYPGGQPMVPGGPDGTKTAPYPPTIPKDKPATLTITLYGGTVTGGVPAQYPVPISVNVAPVTNRASWIRPPYRGSGGARQTQVVNDAANDAEYR